MVVTAKLPQPKIRQSKLERTASTNVAVNGVSMPTSDGKLHRHGPLLKGHSPSKHHRSSPHHRDGRSSSRGRTEMTAAGTRSVTATAAQEASTIISPSKQSKSQSRRPEAAVTDSRSGAGTLDAFMQQRLEQRPVSLKNLGASLLLQRDEDRNDDGLTHVAVSQEEPPASENDQSTGNLKMTTKRSSRSKQARRSDRLEQALTQVKAVKGHDKVAAAVTSKANASTAATESREQSEMRVDEALRLFEQKYKLNAPDADLTSQTAQDGYVATTAGTSEKKKKIAPVSRAPTAALSSSGHTAKASSAHGETSLRNINGNLLPTTEPVRLGTGAALQASSSLSSNDNGTTTILHCIGSGDGQRSTSASTTVRRLERKGRRYKEVITVVSKSDESNMNVPAAPAAKGSNDPQQPVLNTRIIIEDLTTPQTTKPMTLSEKLDRAKGIKKDAPEHAPLRNAENSSSIESPTQVNALPTCMPEATRPPRSPFTETVEEANARHPNAQARAATTVEDILGGRQSPTYQAVLSTFQDTPSRGTAKGGWLGLSKLISPRWFPRRSSAGTPMSPEIHGGKVTPLIAITHRLPNSSDADMKPKKDSPREEKPQHIQSHIGSGVLCATETVACLQDDDGVMRPKEDEHIDDDASSLFNFHSANSSDKELGDIFSFISSRRGSRDIHEGRKTRTAIATGSESKSKPMPALTQSTVPTDAPALSKPTEVPANESLSRVEVSSGKGFERSTTSHVKEKPKDLRIVTARSRKEHFLSFLSSRNKRGEKKVSATTAGIKAALRPLRRKEDRKKVVPEGTTNREGKESSAAIADPTRTRVQESPDVTVPDAPTSSAGRSPVGDESSRLPADPLSPMGAISQDLTQSTSMESHSTGGMFGIGAFLSTMCGPDKKCEVEQPLPWRECGQADDDHSIIDDETEVKHKQLLDTVSVPPSTRTEPDTENSIVDVTEKSATARKATASPKSADGIDAIETVLHNNKEMHPSESLSPMRMVLSAGNLSVANGSLFNVRISLRYLKGLAASLNKANPNHAMNRSVIVGFVRVISSSALASCSLDFARSRPVNLISSEKGGPLPPVVWSSKRVLDRRRGRLYFSVVLKQLASGGDSIAYSRERIRLVFGLQRGEETIELGSAFFDVDGKEQTQMRLDLPLLTESEAMKKSPFLGTLRRTSNHNSFIGDTHDFSLLPSSVLSTRIDIKAGDNGSAGPLVWEDYIVGDDESFDDSYTPSLCEEQSLADPYESVEVVPLPRGAAILAKSSYMDGCAGATGRDSPADESMSSLRKKDHREPDKQRRRIPNLFGRKKPKACPPPSVAAAQNNKEAVDRAPKEELLVAEVPPEEEADPFLSPISESHSDCSFSAIPSIEDDSSGEESSSVSSKKRNTLTDKAADWVYRGARAAGFFSYSSDEEKMTQFSFGTKDDTQNYPTSDLSESVMTDEASEVVVEQLKYWIQNETSTSQNDEPALGEASTPRTNAASGTSLTEALRTKVDERETNPHQSLEHFKKILLLAQRLNLSPYDLIRRLENGENIEELLHSK